MCCTQKPGWTDTSNGCDGTFGGLTRHECALKGKSYLLSISRYLLNIIFPHSIVQYILLTILSYIIKNQRTQHQRTQHQLPQHQLPQQQLPQDQLPQHQFPQPQLPQKVMLFKGLVMNHEQ